MNQKQAQEIYNLSERAINNIREYAHREMFILQSKEIDTIYAQVLNLLEQKRIRSEGFLNRNKE